MVEEALDMTRKGQKHGTNSELENRQAKRLQEYIQIVLWKKGIRRPFFPGGFFLKSSKMENDLRSRATPTW